MFELLYSIFDTSDFPERWVCGDWSGVHGWTHIVADTAIFGAYTAIPCVLAYFVVRRPSVPFPPVFWWFAAFILSCGVGHLVEATIFWHPWYRLSALVKVVIATVSWGTVLALIPVVPKALALRGPGELEREIAQREQAEEQLQDRARQLAAAQTLAHLGSWQWDISADTVTWSAELYAIFGLDPADFEPTLPEYLAHVHPDDRDQVRQVIETALKRGGSFESEARIVRPDNTIRILHSQGGTIVDEDGRPMRMVGTCQDITERTLAERRVLESLREKEVLLKEVHHRVKNNLAAVSSLFYLQSTQTDDEQTLRILQESQDRVRSMALVHEILYRSENLAAVDFSEYVGVLCQQLMSAYGRPSGNVRLKTDLEHIHFNIDVAVPCGLILNELVSNALKHGFPNDQKGEILVTLRKHGDNDCLLEVADTGVGLPGDAAGESSTSLGLRLVRSLARQIDGDFELAADDAGTKARVTFKAQT